MGAARAVVELPVLLARRSVGCRVIGSQGSVKALVGRLQTRFLGNVAIGILCRQKGER